ncbi:hypothetical protein DFR60_1112 [Hungatella effluvii]|uniref:Transposase/invertase (TIGR01784 family) n=1 Tax=Hungatella effluvii TaxID=1096246 RepID=A0A2V3XZL4_9FIRM|nr:hypothetical protein [Hungatella effluvii]PXX50711.1 hypothetical protein DFR60_1112 [Hungatella effluvii]
MSNENDAYRITEIPANFPAEDLVLKSAMQFFKDELLSYLGITEEPVTMGPTEFVHLEAKQLYEDFNFIKPDRSWIHLEFESDGIREEDLRRFRSYEAVTSFIRRADITTYVICSSTVKEIRFELNTGYNTYRIIPVRLKDRDSDELFAGLFKKQKQGVKPNRADLVPLLLATLMSGNTDQKERIILANRLITESGTLSESDMVRMQAVLYTLANKFLSKDDLNQVKEALFMTPLGQMLVNDGIEKGMEMGMEKGIKKGIEKGASALISACQEVGLTYDSTRKKLIEKLEVDASTASRYMEEFWSVLSKQ